MRITPPFDMEKDIAQAISDGFAAAMRNAPVTSAIADSRGREFEIRSYLVDGEKRVSFRITQNTPSEKWTSMDVHDVVDVIRRWQSDVLDDPGAPYEMRIITRDSGTIVFYVGTAPQPPLIPPQPCYPPRC